MKLLRAILKLLMISMLGKTHNGSLPAQESAPARKQTCISDGPQAGHQKTERNWLAGRQLPGRQPGPHATRPAM